MALPCQSQPAADVVPMSRGIRVRHVVPSFYPATVYGGPIFSVHYMCEALARIGADVRVSTTNANGKTTLDVCTSAPVALGAGYRVRYYRDFIIGRFSWSFTRGLPNDIVGCDVVHAHGVLSLHVAWALLVAAVFRRPVLISPRGTLTAWGLKNKRPVLKRLWLGCIVRPLSRDPRRVAWHATSKLERQEIIDQFPDAQVGVIPNGLDCGAFDRVPSLPQREYMQRFFPNAVTEAGRPTVLVGLGRLHTKKSFATAVHALHSVLAKRSNCLLLIAGSDDGERGALEKLVEDRGLRGKVEFVGELHGDEKIRFLKGADLFLFPSHSENFGMVALEALAAGVPVIASRNTPWSELDRFGSGMWVDNAPEAFAMAVEALLASDQAALRERARKHAGRYDLTVVASELLGAYLRLMQGFSHSTRPGGQQDETH